MSDTDDTEVELVAAPPVADDCAVFETDELSGGASCSSTGQSSGTTFGWLGVVLGLRGFRRRKSK